MIRDFARAVVIVLFFLFIVAEVQERDDIDGAQAASVTQTDF